jgi:hypothetical protein
MGRKRQILSVEEALKNREHYLEYMRNYMRIRYYNSKSATLKPATPRQQKEELYKLFQAGLLRKVNNQDDQPEFKFNIQEFSEASVHPSDTVQN